MSKGLVSILIPCYNCEAYLSACLESVVNQTYPNIEIICVDDCSEDSTRQILSDFVSDRLFRVVLHEENLGVSVTRNELLTLASGQFILFIDSDDWIEPDMVERMMESVDDSVDIVSCSHDDRSAEGHLLGTVRLEPGMWAGDQQLLFFAKQIGAPLLWNKIFRKRLIGSIRFEENFRIGEDSDFCWKIFQISKGMRIVPDTLYHYRHHSDSAMAGDPSSLINSLLDVWINIETECKRKYPEVSKAVSSRILLYACSYFKRLSVSNTLSSADAKRLSMVARSRVLHAPIATSINYDITHKLFCFVLAMNYRLAWYVAHLI